MAVGQADTRASRRRPIDRRRRRAPPGASPGTLVADPSAIGTVIRFVGYGPDGFEDHGVPDLDKLETMIGKWPVTWINVDGLANLDLIRRLGDMFGLHGLALEDVVNVHQRPKVEDYEDHIFIVTRMMHGEEAPLTEQVSMFLNERMVLTFQERPGDCFDPVRDRIRKRRGQIRSRGADYLAYALLDAVIDGYFPVLERYGERLEALENSVMAEPSRDQVLRVHDMKRDLLSLRRAIWPQREMINALTRASTAFVSEQTQVYIRDCYDHTVQLMDVVETYREVASGLLDIYLSSVGTKMNEIMKVLTIIATIFIPLSFIAGLYGMNFDPKASPWNMPELAWYWGYPVALALMLVVALGLLAYFRHKGWLGGRANGGTRWREPPE